MVPAYATLDKEKSILLDKTPPATPKVPNVLDLFTEDSLKKQQKFDEKFRERFVDILHDSENPELKANAKNIVQNLGENFGVRELKTNLKIGHGSLIPKESFKWNEKKEYAVTFQHSYASVTTNTSKYKYYRGTFFKN